MAYRDDITALGADHLWRFDGNYLDSIGSADGTNSGFSATASAICEDATNSARCDGTGDRIALTVTGQIAATTAARYIGGWVELNSVQLPPKSLFGLGNTSNQFRFVCWAGNALMLDIVDGSSVFQAYSNRVLKPNRTYHVMGFLNASGDFGLCIDGVLQSITNPSDRQFSAGSWVPPLSNYDFGNPGGSTEVGNQTVLLNGATNCDYNFWCSFDNALTVTQIREELFEKGALPDVTITNQAGLDALADSVRPDAPLCIRVDVAGSISLSADNVTFDPLASIHVQYTGTGTLTWTNNNGSNASIGSTPNGGTISFVTPATLTVSDLQPNTEVRFYVAGTATELAGVENSGTSFASTVQASSVDVVLISIDYEIKKIEGVDMTSGDVTLVAGQFFDRNYENP
jgi:hypothetical protein